MKFALLKSIRFILLITLMVFIGCKASSQKAASNYSLDIIKKEFQVKWPNNKTINLVFHGHSVVAGYYTGGVVKTYSSYPFLVLKKIKEQYPYAVVNSIVTAIGGEQSEQGAKRFKEEVLNHKPDVLFLDYALNDRSIGLERAKTAWELMIQEALDYGAKVILLTPTPDLRENILSEDTELAKHSEQIKTLAKKYHVGLIDNYAQFKKIAKHESLKPYMAQNNHINEQGHIIVANQIFNFFILL